MCSVPRAGRGTTWPRVAEGEFLGEVGILSINTIEKGGYVQEEDRKSSPESEFGH